jgi:glucose-1-phosphate cytidylyltransferase
MKVVLFCGGLGTRMKEYSETIPKPMVEIGYRPLMWHLMKHYAHFGHTDFILCLGYRGDYIKEYFLRYNECMSNDFTLAEGGRTVKLFNRDISDWTITFVDTGLNANIGQRLSAIRHLLEGEEIFMANYTDGLADLDLACYLDYFQRQNRAACFLSCKPSATFHVVEAGTDGVVTQIDTVQHTDLRINAGFFLFKQEIFDYMRAGEELVLQPFQRLIARQQLITYRYDGFWASIDTFKEKKMFDDYFARGDMPWVVWDATSKYYRAPMDNRL